MDGRISHQIWEWRIKIDCVNWIYIIKFTIYFNFVHAVPLSDVIKITRFLMSSHKMY